MSPSTEALEGGPNISAAATLLEQLIARDLLQVSWELLNLPGKYCLLAKVLLMRCLL